MSDTHKAYANSKQSTPVTFMDHLSEAERQALARHARRERYTSGQIICQEGEQGDRLYIIESGRVAVLKEVGEERSILLGHRGPGEILGEMSLVGRQPRSATLIAEVDTQLLCIQADAFSALLSKQRDLSWAVLNVLNDRLHEADQARAAIAQEEATLTRRLEHLTDRSERLAELARVRQETIELLAHDLRTPLAVVSGCLQMLDNSLPPKTQQTVADIIHLAEQSLQRTQSLIRELLEAARRETPAAALVRRPVHLAHLLQTTAESARIQAQKAGVHLRLQPLPDMPDPPGDRLKLERAVMNLVDNALSYTPPGGSVTVAAALGDDEIEISVTDTGPGVPPEYRRLIFERFAQVPGMQQHRDGLGLGLYYCKQVVQAHGGRIWVEPGPQGVGSRFAFTLPLKEDVHD